MAGKHQHHVWQMLQRGFGRKHGRYHHVWVYSKDVAPYRTSTYNFGAQDFYYSEGSDHLADEAITKFENSAQSKILEIRELPDGAQIDSLFVSNFLAHLEMRSRFIREELSRVGSNVLETLESHLSDENSLEDLLLAYLKKNPKYLEDKLAEHGLSPGVGKALLHFIKGNPKSLVGEDLKDLIEEFTPIFSKLRADIPKISRAAHLSTMKRDFSQVQRKNIHRDLNYILVRIDSQIILPDTCVAFLSKNRVMPFTQKGSRIQEVILPIGYDHYIYGFKRNPIKRSGGQLRRILASCAFENFVALDDLPELKAVRSGIGKNAKIVSEQDFRNSVSLRSLRDAL